MRAQLGFLVVQGAAGLAADLDLAAAISPTKRSTATLNGRGHHVALRWLRKDQVERCISLAEERAWSSFMRTRPQSRTTK